MGGSLSVRVTRVASAVGADTPAQQGMRDCKVLSYLALGAHGSVLRRIAQPTQRDLQDKYPP
ncbi:hypothetical protein GCM10011504_52400 [Siccirubricoccus deserti]|nr:hypothetical protein GCM10011504_52400 [Siccirubricoccus deserti]